MARAVRAGHLRSVAISLPPDLCKVVEWNRDKPAFDQSTNTALNFWSERAKVLKTEDAQMVANAPAHLRKIAWWKAIGYMASYD